VSMNFVLTGPGVPDDEDGEDMSVHAQERTRGEIKHGTTNEYSEAGEMSLICAIENEDVHEMEWLLYCEKD
jgi:hypothetical protein